MPDHVRFILRHAAYGAILAAVFVGGLLYMNVGNIWHLVTHTAEGPFALFVLYVFFTITLGSAQIGYKIMSISDDDDDKPRGGRRDTLPVLDALPVPVRTQDRH